MALKVGSSDVDALYVGASAVDAAYLGASSAFEGEGGEPGWVEDMGILGGTLPTHAISFTENEAWTAADGIVAMASILGTDATGGIEVAWAPTAFDPNDVTVNGIHDANGGGEVVAFTGAALTKILAGCTIVAVYRNQATCEFSALLIGNVDASRFIVGGERNDAHCKAYSYNVIDEQILNCLTTAAAPGALNKIAITITATRLEMSVNGSAALAIVLDASEYENMVCAAFDPPEANQGYAVSYAVYDPVAVGDLPTISV